MSAHGAAPGESGPSPDSGLHDGNAESLALPALAEQIITADAINAEHRLACSRAQEAIVHAIRCGELLTRKKAELKHGEFTSWIAGNCKFSQATANNYMKAARAPSALEISAIRHLYDSGRRPKQSEASATSISVAREVAQLDVVEQVDDPILTLRGQVRAKKIRASTFTVKFVDEVAASADVYASLQSDFGDVGELRGFPAADARKYAAMLADSMRVMRRLHKRLLTIAERAT